VEPTSKKSFKEEDEQIQELSASFMKAAIGDVIQERKPGAQTGMTAGMDNDEMMSNSSDSDSSSDEKDKKEASNKKAKKEKVKGKHIKKNEKLGGLPRKCFKRLIMKELD
jgi:hypothetical protein